MRLKIIGFAAAVVLAGCAGLLADSDSSTDEAKLPPPATFKVDRDSTRENKVVIADLLPKQPEFDTTDALAREVLAKELVGREAQRHGPELRGKPEPQSAVREYTDGHAASTSFRIDLSAPKPQPMSLQRGSCYVVVFRLDDGAAWSATAVEHNIGIEFTGPDISIHAGPGLIGRDAVGAPGCLFRSGAYELKMRVYTSDEPLGVGMATARLYVRRTRKGELARLEREDREERLASEREADRRKREHCAKCREQYYKDQSGFEDCAAQLYDRRACY